jgi:hypothetical protein
VITCSVALAVVVYEYTAGAVLNTKLRTPG